MTTLAAAFAAGATLAVSTAGAGEFRTARGVYPLGGLRYLRQADGSGALQFTAGAGAVALVGADAKQVSARRYLLQIDRVVLASNYPATATCDTRQNQAGTFVRITCRGQVGVPVQAFTLRWHAR